MKNNNLGGFLKNYQPRYWIATGQILNRPSLKKTVLARAFLTVDKKEQNYCENNICFKLIREKDSFGEKIYEISYNN